MIRNAWVYRNLTTGGFSVMVKNKVLGQADFILMQNVELRVREGGNQKVTETGQRNVHAFCIGDILSTSHDDYKLPKNLVQITYNPHDHFNFIIKKTGKSIFDAKYVVLYNNQMWASKD
jgi:hypothetical protein